MPSFITIYGNSVNMIKGEGKKKCHVGKKAYRRIFTYMYVSYLTNLGET